MRFNNRRQPGSVPQLDESAAQDSAKKGLASLLQKQPGVRVGDILNLVRAMRKKRGN